MQEIVAPNGYEVTTDTTFYIDEYGNVVTTGSTTLDKDGNVVLLVQDYRTPKKFKPKRKRSSGNPDTADYFDLYMMLLKLFILGFFSSSFYLYKQNKV